MSFSVSVSARLIQLLRVQGSPWPVGRGWAQPANERLFPSWASAVLSGLTVNPIRHSATAYARHRGKRYQRSVLPVWKSSRGCLWSFSSRSPDLNFYIQIFEGFLPIHIHSIAKLLNCLKAKLSVQMMGHGKFYLFIFSLSLLYLNSPYSMYELKHSEMI